MGESPEPQRLTLFLDRDGVINREGPERILRWDDFHFEDGVLEALAVLARTRVTVVIVTNQSVVGRGLISREALLELHERMLACIHAHGGRVHAIHACLHAPDDGCRCRKPEPGLLLDAARELGVDLRTVVFAGDAASDLEAAARAGAIPVLILTGKGRATAEAVREGRCRAARVFPTLRELARALEDGALGGTR